MANPSSPNYNSGVGRLVTDRYDFQDHVDGYTFNHNADAIFLNPPVLISTTVTNVQSAIEELKGALTVPIIPDATTTSKGVIQITGDIGGSSTYISVLALRGYPIASTPPTTGYVLTWNGSNWAPAESAATTTLNGDVTGSAAATTVVKINGKPVVSTTPNTNDALVWNGSSWNPVHVVPSGTGLVSVTSGAIDSAATVNIRYASGKLQTDTNIQWKNASITGDLSWAPTSSNKTLTLPNATDTLVARTTTDTLTNKTISASSNTITDTGTLTGDILVSNGTKFVRQAKGINGTFWGVSGGVAGYYAPPAGSLGVAGTGFVTVTSGVVDPNATVNVRYTSGKFQTDTNIQWKNTSITGDLSWTPTSSNKTLTLPDATDTIVARATTDTLTNKTISASSNTITDTSQATGDLFKNNGSKFVRFARGSSLQYLRVNAGGTDLEWATLSAGTSSGAAGTVQASNGSGGFQATTILDNGSNIKTALPLAGNSASSLPFRFKVTRITLAGELAYVMTAAQYECPIIIVSGVTDAGSSYLDCPLSDGGYFCVHNKTDGAINIRPSGGGSSLDIAVTNKSAIAWYDATDNKMRGVVSSVLS